jgi:hypothetical protein
MGEISPFEILKGKETSVRLSWGMCELIARYYEFPTAVFLMTDEDKMMALVGTRKDSIKKRIAVLENLKKEIKLAVEQFE